MKSSRADQASIECASPRPKEKCTARFSAIALLAILLLAALLRFAYWGELKSQPDYASPVMDAWTHDFWARALLTGDWSPRTGMGAPLSQDTPYGRPPGYPYFLAAVYAISGGSYHAIRILQFAIGMLNLVLLYLLGKKLFGRAVGLLGALFMAIYWGFIFFEGELQAATVVLCFTLVFFLLASTWVKRFTPWRALAGGFLLGLSALFRPEVMLLIPLVPLWAWWATRRQSPRRRVWAGLLLCLLGAGLAIAPATVRNYRVSGEFIVLTINGGVNLYAGNNADADGVYPCLDMRKPLGVHCIIGPDKAPLCLEALKKKQGREDLGYADLSRYFFDLALAYIIENPGRTLTLLCKKAIYYWSPYEISNNKVLMIERAESSLLRRLPGFSLMAIPAFLGLIMFWRYRLRVREGNPYVFPIAILLIGYVFVRFATMMPFFVAGRFRIQIVPVLILFAAYALVTILRLIRQRAWGEFKVWLPMAIALTVLLGTPWLPYEPSKAMWHFGRALSHLCKIDQEPEKALEEYQQAAKAPGDTGLFPRGQFYSQVVKTLISLDRPEEALEWSRRGLAADTSYAPAYDLHGTILQKMGREEEAVPFFERAVVLDPLLLSAHHHLGAIQERLGNDQEAIDAYEALLKIDSQDHYADYHLARLYQRLGKGEAAARHRRSLLEKPTVSPDLLSRVGREHRQAGHPEEALAYFQKASAAAPDHAPLHHDLGNLLVDMGRYEEAIGIFQEILRRNPDDYYAHYNWGRALALSGQREAAIELFKKTLKAHPQHAQAHNYLGYELEQSGAIEEAIAHYSTALAIDPSFALSTENLRNAREKQKALGQETKSP